tara:strand:+ start:426 stop:650 length:225 start_codon:yes stop_codon:yes gene_type:complete
MYLYKVKGFKDKEVVFTLTYDIRYIIAELSSDAIAKYITLDNVYKGRVTATPLCRRDAIIPTIEPIKEVLDETN